MLLVLDVDVCMYLFFVFKQKTAYEMRISDWSSDVCSSDLDDEEGQAGDDHREGREPVEPVGEVHGVAEADDQHHYKDIIERPERDIEIGRASCRERVCQYV